MMPQINRRVSLFSVTIILSMLGHYCFAQVEGGSNTERRSVTITASVGAPPPGVTIKEALVTFPTKVDFEYQYGLRTFTTNTPSFTVDSILTEEFNVTIESNTGLSHEDSEIVKTVLTPFIQVGGSTIESQNEMSKWCNAGETPAAITFGIKKTDQDQLPPEGKYTGEMVLVFEPASE